MRRFFLSIAVLGLGTIAPPLSGQDQEAIDTAVATSTEEWLVIVDAGNYAESWEHFAPVVQGNLSVQQWEEAVRPVRDQAGPLSSREVQAVQSISPPPGAPEGEYMMVEFRSSFESIPQAVETVYLIDEDGQGWLIAGYFVRPA